ncbi:hypothetical protein F5Y05DRAFT_390871 [Hypoxylon sp. FL0543]|nr:hypothetical protein F5Y05DRAFT_390871 [Hypoxylon sp. FL0543]
MLLTGVRLAWVLDLIDRHHKLLSYLFNIEYDPLKRLSEPAKQLCNKLRDLVSPYIEALFVTQPSFEDKIRQRVWDGIYKRIRLPITHPYRFSNISCHRHIRVDDHVQRLLSKSVRQGLPKNFEVADYGLPRYLRKGAPNLHPHRVQPTTDLVLRGQHSKNDMVYSPTAEIMAGPAEPIAETYYDPLRGYLRCPLPIQTSIHPSQWNTPCDSSSVDSNSTESNFDSNGSDEVDSETDSDSDFGEADHDYSLHTKQCSLCSLARRVNSLIASIRIDVARGTYPLSILPGATQRVGEKFEEGWLKIQATGGSPPPQNYRNDPDDKRMWNAQAKGLLEFLTARENEAREARRARLRTLLTEPRPGEDIDIYEDEDDDDNGSDSDEEKTDEDKENDGALRELSWFLNRMDVEDLEDSTDDDHFVPTSTTMPTPQGGQRLQPFTLDGRPLVFLR